MLALGSGCKYRLSLAERSDCTETIINQLLADSYQNPIREWQVKTSSGLPLILHYGELYNYFIIYYNVIIIEIKCTINVMHLNHPKTIPHAGPWKNCLPRNQSLVPKRLGTTTLMDEWIKKNTHTYIYKTHTHIQQNIIQYYSALKKKEILPFVTAWIDLEGIILN